MSATTGTFTGRTKITSEYKSKDMLDRVKLTDAINTAMTVHRLNKMQIDYLMNYRNGSQPILEKEKTIRDEINNKIVLNHAQMVTRMVVGYFLGTPIQYIQSGDSKKEDIDKLNQYVAFEDKASVDTEIGNYQSICGTAYRIIYTDGIFADEVPFEDKSLNPSTTFVVYENTIAEKPLLGITYYNILDPKGSIIGVRIYAYTEYGQYEIDTKSDVGTISEDSELTFNEYNVGGIPIIEYPNNIWRIGDWELCLGLMDAINSLQSGRLDDIDQIVQSLLVFINAEINAETYNEMRERGVVLLKNNTNMQTEVTSITNALDQGGMNLFSEELEKILYALLSIPDRSQRGGGGGDTGQAVELRDGWADLEVLARNKELVYKKSEKQTLRIILNILNNTQGMNLTLLDVDIKFSRNKNNNLLVKAQSYTMLLASKTLSPADCLTIVDLVSDVNEFIARGQAFWKDGFAGMKEAQNRAEMSDVQLETAKNPPDPTVGADGKVIDRRSNTGVAPSGQKNVLDKKPNAKENDN